VRFLVAGWFTGTTLCRSNLHIVVVRMLGFLGTLLVLLLQQTLQAHKAAGIAAGAAQSAAAAVEGGRGSSSAAAGGDAGAGECKFGSGSCLSRHVVCLLLWNSFVFQELSAFVMS
jgi:hypothetical protein